MRLGYEAEAELWGWVMRSRLGYEAEAGLWG